MIPTGAQVAMPMRSFTPVAPDSIPSTSKKPGQLKYASRPVFSWPDWAYVVGDPQVAEARLESWQTMDDRVGAMQDEHQDQNLPGQERRE